MEPPQSPARPPRIAVALPCYNEAAAVGRVVDDFRAHLPEAEVVVLDNASDDGTAEVAAARGARVMPVPDRGKGFAVRAAFENLRDFDVVLMADGDGTYPAEEARRMIAPILEGRAETVVGARRPEPGARAMAPVRALGNVLLRAAFLAFIGHGAGDLLSGYRAFSRRFLNDVRLRSEGFEVETELAIKTVVQELAAVDVEVAYRPRIEGTESKLRPLRDGRRILATIVREGFRLRPARGCVVVATTAVVLAAPVFYWALAAG